MENNLIFEFSSSLENSKLYILS